MKNYKKALEATKIGEGTDAVIPEDIKPLEFIQKAFKLLREWGDQEKGRGFLLMATCDSSDKDNEGGLVVGCKGDDEVLARMMLGALGSNEDLQKMLTGAFELRKQANQ